MCGIFGAVFVPRDVTPRLDAVAKAMLHRGPDVQRALSMKDSHFVFDRLSILDLSEAGMQPMVSRDKDVVLVFNGEIYNYRDIRKECESRGAVFRSTSDTEVILEGYRLFGDRILDWIDGMFAIGIWDEQKRRLLLARDRPGKKPLYYTGGRLSDFRFASTVRALIESGVQTEVDLDALPSLFTFGYPRPPRTMYRAISQLPPAHYLVLEEGKAPVIKKYWENPFTKKSIPFGVEEACIELRSHVQRSVSRRMQADVPVGAFLSGGMDSSVIVATMASMSDKPVKTFCAGFSHDPRYDEREYARLVSRHYGTEHQEFTLEPSSFDIVEELVQMHDGPFGDSSAIPMAFVSKLARSQVSVALSGDGGDELFAGYMRFLIAEATEMVSPSILGAANSFWLRLSSEDRGLLMRTQRFLKRASFSLPDRLMSWQTYFGLELHELLRADLTSHLAMAEPIEQSRAVLEDMTTQTTLAKILKYNYETYLPDDLLVKADRSSMMHSLELRSPLLDVELTEYVARLPDSFKRRGITTKWILREAYKESLPREVVSRKKMGFGVPLDAWFRTDLNRYLQERFAPGAPLFDYIQASYVERLLKQHFRGLADHSHRLWLLLTFAVWLESSKRAST